MSRDLLVRAPVRLLIWPGDPWPQRPSYPLPPTPAPDPGGGGTGADISQAVTASESLPAGALVSLWDDAGTLKARRANATDNTKPAVGFVTDPYSPGASATVYFVGVNRDLSGLTLGADYYLSTTPGAVTTTPPSASGNLVQRVGQALSPTALAFAPQEIATVT